MYGVILDDKWKRKEKDMVDEYMSMLTNSKEERILTAEHKETRRKTVNEKFLV